LQRGRRTPCSPSGPSCAGLPPPAWFAAAFTGCLAVIGVVAETIARRYRPERQPTAQAQIRATYRADVIPGAPALGPARKALTAGARTKED